jgi:hypothetical protein
LSGTESYSIWLKLLSGQITDPYGAVNSHTVLGEKSRDSSIGIATGWTGGLPFTPLHGVQTGSRVDITSYAMDTGGASLGGEAYHSPQCNAEIDNGRAILSFHGKELSLCLTN